MGNPMGVMQQWAVEAKLQRTLFCGSVAVFLSTALAWHPPFDVTTFEEMHRAIAH
ncbi:MAG: hypothetical protein NWQ13_05170 [Glaciimonas sp.]|nr:hypothetical protein [Glaciimonas sp.]